jgi:acetylornithine deacetylase
MMDPVIALLSELVAIPSINPSLVPGASGEGAIGEAVAAWLRRRGLDVIVEEVVPGRSNVVGVLEGRAAGPTLMLCGHLDTVGTTGMDTPFDPVLRDGRLHGRGAQDMKAGVAAIMSAAADLAEAGGLSRGRLLVACVVDEEYASTGADALVRGWFADAAVVTEPTGLAIGVAHKGFSAAEVTVYGRAAHGSRPQEGIDAILLMGRVLGRLADHDRDLQTRRPHPLLGTASLHASTITGGGELSSYPARCTLLVERRTLPGEPLNCGADDLTAIGSYLSGQDQQFRADVRLVLARPAYEIDAAHWLPAALESAAGESGVTARPEGLSYWTDAAVLGHAGIPAVLFGPGGAGLHTPGEYVLVDDVVVCRNVLITLARTVCEQRMGAGGAALS